MPEPVDWEALHRLFQPRDRPAPRADWVIYIGEEMPRWLARDLMQERAAIMEYDGGMIRAKAEELTRRSLG